MARSWENACGAGQLLIDYVKEHGWFYVGNIFHDNGRTTQPHTANGCICISEENGALYTINKIDPENTIILEHMYLAAPSSHVSTQQTVTVFPLEMIQSWDALLLAQAHHYESKGPMDEFLLPTFPDEATVLGMEKDAETKLYPMSDGMVDVGLFDDKDEYKDWVGASNVNERPHRGTVIGTIDVHPDHPEWGKDKYVGIRIEQYQNFVNNQKMFCEAMNKFFGVGDCF